MPSRKSRNANTVRPYKGELNRFVMVDDPYREEKKDGRAYIKRGSVGTAMREVEAIKAARLPLLFAHFGVDAGEIDAWRKLAFALAEAHVPGFQLRYKTGAPTKMTALEKSVVFEMYERKLAGGELTGDPYKAFLKDSEVRSKFPELSSIRRKRLQNLISEIRGMPEWNNSEPSPIFLRFGGAKKPSQEE